MNTLRGLDKLLLIIALVAVTVLFAGWVGRLATPQTVPGVDFYPVLFQGVQALLLLGVLTFAVMLYRRQATQHHQIRSMLLRDYRQVEAMFSLYTAIRPKHPLPSMRIWAASPDFAVEVLSQIQTLQPRCVVELGSGVSTLVTGYGLQQLVQAPDAHLYSFEHDAAFAETTAENIHRHKLSETVSLHVVPLVKQSNTTLHLPADDFPAERLWYDLEQMEAVLAGAPPIDLLIVDGPPSRLFPMIRYPTLPALIHLLSPRAVLLLDDGNRAYEQQMVAKWLKSYPYLKKINIRTEKGTTLLRGASGPETRVSPEKAATHLLAGSIRS